jgi:AraC family transcriptional activator of pobA
MAKETIQLLQLDESRYGVGIFSLSDPVLLDYVTTETVFPHRHDHYCCFFIETGHLNFTIDFQNLEITHSSLLVSCPGQIHQFGFANEVTGWVIAFDTRFIDQSARLVIEQSFAKAALLPLNPAEKEWFVSILQLIYSAVEEKKPTNFHYQLIQTLINAFFFKTVTIFQLQEEERIQDYSLRSIEIAKTFHQFVKEHFLVLKKPADYASKMNITVSYLNDTVKSITGFPSTYFIQHEIFREAQRLLFYTNKSVKEIAFQLGYEDYKYFIRLFSKTVGTSPASFRKNTKSS